MKGYGQFCPVALATELLCERWTLLVVRELVAGSTRFNELRRGVPLMSPSLLTQRLRTLEEAGVVDRIERAGGGVEYRLTEAGRDLRALIDTLGAWGARWSRAMREEDLDPGLLMWDVRRRLDLDTMPRDRLIVLFEFDDLPAQKSRYWLLRDRDEVDMCVRDPGGDVDLRVATEVATFVDIWLGRRPLRASIRSGDVRLEGTPALKRAFPSWLLLSETAPAAKGRPA
jgi:DNA-binding HxlR family transcriptional regulator